MKSISKNNDNLAMHIWIGFENIIKFGYVAIQIYQQLLDNKIKASHERIVPKMCFAKSLTSFSSWQGTYIF